MSGNFNPAGVDLFGEAARRPNMGALAERYEFAPFSVLDARQGAWQERKRQWIAQGIQSELGRGAELMPTGADSACGGNGFAGNRGGQRASPGGSIMPAADSCNQQRGDSTGKPIEARPGVHTHGASATIKRQGGSIGHDGSKVLAERAAGGGANSIRFGEEYGGSGPAACTGATSTSIFDPVLAELMVRWFAPEGGQVVDPFAGGSVRGIVSGMLGRRYWGCDLSTPQILANRIQHEAICPEAEIEWVIGDSRVTMVEAPRADFVLSCPPYGNLEVYSDDPRDLSTMEYPEFLAVYRLIIELTVDKMKPGTMACFVVGDFRDKKGYYYGFVADTINAFRDAGAKLYNDGILVTAIGSLPVRISGQFDASRKLGKTHQNVLVFKKP